MHHMTLWQHGFGDGVVAQEFVTDSVNADLMIRFICINEEYRYLLAIAILASLYTAWQTFVHLSKRDFFDRRTSILLDFSGDQIVAYLLISAASSAIPLTNRFREGQDNIFTDSAASAITMAVLAFVSLALSALFSGYKLSSTHSFV
ncbi:hypothetical protein N665_3999s0004 [Sinapis alba]|nr:hypothetical protein N665_3999s0004 [Sinapis alba]